MILLAIAAVGVGWLWAASYSAPLTWEIQTHGSRIVTWAHEGRAFASALPEGNPMCGYTRTWGGLEATIPSFAFRYKSFSNGLRRLFVLFLSCPIWVIAATFVAYPAAVLVCFQLRRWSRRRGGKCLKCAYDLRGNVSGRCPECGDSALPGMLKANRCTSLRHSLDATHRLSSLSWNEPNKQSI